MGNQFFNLFGVHAWLSWLTNVLAQLQDGQNLGGGFKVCDQNMSPVRWTVFGVSVLGALLCLYTLFVNSGVEAALSSLNHSRLHGLLERHERRAKIIEQLLNRPAQVLSSITTLNVICCMLTPALAISAIHQFSLYGIEVEVLIVLVILLVLVLTRAVPKGIAVQRPESIALRWSGFVNAETAVVLPIVSLTNFLANLVLRRVGVLPLPANTVVTHEELAMLANQGQDEGIIHQEEREMIKSIFEFGDTIVREVMIPRLDIKSIQQTSTLDQTLDVILKCGHSRLPVYAEDIDHIIGILYAKDLLRFLRAHTDNTRFELPRILRPVHYVPESKKVDALFQELQNSRVHIAIVIDEYGGTAGLVTIEDLLEEIVGEIQDEYDTEAPQAEWRDADEVVVDARMNLADANELLGTNWESENVDTIGGFVYDQLGRIPVPGDELTVDNVRISVMTLIGNRLKKLLLTRLHPEIEKATETQPLPGEIAPAEADSSLDKAGSTLDVSDLETAPTIADARLETMFVPTGPELAASPDSFSDNKLTEAVDSEQFEAENMAAEASTNVAKKPEA